jgi:hypothetical protein
VNPRIINRERLRPLDRRLGRHVHHDSESHRYPFDTAGIPIRAVRHQRHVPVWDQGDIGDCVANAALGILATGPFYATYQHLAQQPYPLTEAGCVKAYIDLTATDDVPGQYKPGDPNSEDTGSDGLSAAKLLTGKGAISGYQHTFTLDDALKALQVVPLAVGTVWTSGMEEPNRQGLVSVTGSELGGHEYIADEYDDQRGWVGFQNSWSTSWGVAGRFYMQAEDFGSLLERDGDVTVFTPISQPAPQPTPSPQPVPVPPITADETFARQLHTWLAHRPHFYPELRADVQTWLTAKGL